MTQSTTTLNELELAEVIQSSNLNFLFGAGLSRPFLPELGDIERRLNEATEKEATEDEKVPIYKEYLEKVMIPNKRIVNGSENSDEYKKTKANYENFFRKLSEILLKRKSTILSKQANIFTTNIDVMLETTLESLELEYNDGFSGRFQPVFGIENYKKSIQQRSLHFDHISEIPVFNIVKIHGSLTWEYKDSKRNEIKLSPRLDHFGSCLIGKNDDEFLKGYRKLLVVNPEETKHLESVLNLYYSELLRLYSSELEKENSVLFVMGFSMDDEHIKEITLRAARSNPTLRIYVFCYCGGNKQDMKSKMKVSKYLNIKIVAPDDNNDNNRLSLDRITEDYFDKLWETSSKKTNGNNNQEDSQK